MTNEELDAARAEEAWRVREVGESAMDAYRRLVRTGWTPAPAIDPLVEAFKDFTSQSGSSSSCRPERRAEVFRQSLAKHNLAIVEIARESITPNHALVEIVEELSSKFSRQDDLSAREMLEITLKRGMEIARDQDKAEPVITETRCLDPIGCNCDGYCICKQAEPVAPVPVDRENHVFQAAFSMDDIDDGVAVIRTYGDERFAEGERGGIERAIAWCKQWTYLPTEWPMMMRRDLLGGAGDAQ